MLSHGTASVGLALWGLTWLDIVPNVFGLVLVAVLILVVVSWQRWYTLRQNGQPYLEFEPRPAVPWGLVDLGVVVMILLFTQGVAFGIARNMYGLEMKEAAKSQEGQADMIFFFSAATFATWLLSLAYMRLRNHANYIDLGGFPGPWWDDVKQGCWMFGLLVVPVYLIQLIITQVVPVDHPIIDLLTENPSPRYFAATAWMAVIVAPIVEEYLFRVYLQGWLENLAEAQRQGDQDPLVYQGLLQRVCIGGGRPVIDRPGKGSPATPPPRESASRDVPISAASPAPAISPAAAADRESLQEGPNPYAPPRAIGESGPATAVEETVEPLRPQPVWWPIIVSSVIFAAAHLGNGADPIPLFPLAIGLGLLYQKTHRVLPCIVVHMLVNGFSLCQLAVYLATKSAE